VQKAMVSEQAIQCGFCTPGIVISAAALLARNADPSEAEVKAAIPNLCRCGVYPRLVRAVQRAGRLTRGVDPDIVPGPSTSSRRAGAGTGPNPDTAPPEAVEGPGQSTQGVEQ
jgi:isoquinoline 1-oxidoreductase alpha subunit